MYGNTFDYVSQPVNMNMNIPMQPIIPQQAVSMPIKPEVTVTVDKSGYRMPGMDKTKDQSKMVIKTDSNLDDQSKKKSRPSKRETVNSNEIIKPSDNTSVVEDIPTINTYFETAGMIKQSMDQIDNLYSDIRLELEDVRRSRTLKSKYQIMVGLTQNLSDLVNARINAVKELNNCITKSNDMDYKRQKDRKEAMMGAGSGDELAVMNLYKNLVADPNITLGQAGQKIPDYMIQQIQQQIIPSANGVSGIVRPTGENGTATPAFDPTQDAGYINYMANMPASMNALLMEQNPDIKEVVVFDASTGAKWFQVMNTKTNQVIPNMQVTDQMFMEDTTLNIKNRTAQNINLGKVYPLVVINDNVTSQY